MKAVSRRVYSTDSGRLCPECEKPVAACICRQQKQSAGAGDGIVRIRRELKGRRGKPVTIIDGLPPDPKALATMAKALKQLCSSGGTLEDGRILLQGDHRAAVKAYLSERGHTVKLSGG